MKHEYTVELKVSGTVLVNILAQDACAAEDAVVRHFFPDEHSALLNLTPIDDGTVTVSATARIRSGAKAIRMAGPCDGCGRNAYHVKMCPDYGLTLCDVCEDAQA